MIKKKVAAALVTRVNEYSELIYNSFYSMLMTNP